MKIAFIFHNSKLFAYYVPKVAAALKEAGHEVIEKVVSEDATDEELVSDLKPFMQSLEADLVFACDPYHTYYLACCNEIPERMNRLFEEIFFPQAGHNSEAALEHQLAFFAGRFDKEKLHRVRLVKENFFDHILFSGEENRNEIETALRAAENAFSKFFPNCHVAFAKRPEAVLMDTQATLIIDYSSPLGKQIVELLNGGVSDELDCEIIILPVIEHIGWLRNRGINLSGLPSDEEVIEKFLEKMSALAQA